MDALLDKIRAGKLDPVYVVSSAHPILVERFLVELRDAAVPPNLRGFNYDVIEGKPTANRILAAAQTLPMMAARRMVFVRDLGPMVADEASQLLSYLDAPNPTTVLAAVTSKLDKRLKLYATLGKKGWLHVLEAPRQLGPWVNDEARRHEVSIESSAIARLIDIVGGDLSRLSSSLVQLGHYAAGRKVTAADVDELIAETRERSVFELTDAIGAGDRVRALLALDSLADQRESAIGVIALLARHVRQLAIMRELQQSGAPRGEYAQRIGVPPFVVDKLAAQTRLFSGTALSRATSRLASADKALKGGGERTDIFSQSMIKAMGRDLGERVLLEQLVGGLLDSAR